MIKRTMPGLGALVLVMNMLPLLAQHINHPLGLDPNLKAENAGSIDQVDLFSGTLTARIPIGSFNLLYNSNVWRYRGETNDDGSPAIAGRVDWQMTAGVGWHLGWGEVYSPSHAYNDSADWLFVDDLGVHHVFHDRNLHEGETPSDGSFLYTRDGSYLRLHRIDNRYVSIEFPDGSKRLFDSGTTGLQTTYHLHKIWNPVAVQQVPLPEPDFVIEYDRDPGGTRIIDKEWRTITDRFGRVTSITLSSDFHELVRVVTQIDIPGTAGQTSTYKFTYREKPLRVTCKDDWDGTTTTRTAPFLIDVKMPDGTHFNMEDGDDDVRYYRDPGCGVEDLPGIIRGMQLPTGGQIEWTFQNYVFPFGVEDSPFNTSAGVKTRQLLDHAGSTQGDEWHYRVSSLDDAGPESFDRDLIVEVVYPDGRCAKNYFNAIYVRHSVVEDFERPELGKRGWERGLPFVYHTSVGTGGEEKFLSSELYEGHDTANHCSGDIVQTTYVRYRRDVLPGISTGSPEEEWYRVNRGVEQTRLVYNNDGNRYVETAATGFNGVGAFRFTTRKGNLWADSDDNELRFTGSDTDVARGSYPGSFTPVGEDEPWIFGLSTFTLQDEQDAVGGKTAKVERQFDADGFLRCARVLATGTTRGDNDIVTVYERDPADPLGLVRHEKTYGGDIQDLVPGSVCGCDVEAMTPEFWVSHDYENGALVASWQVDPANPSAPVPFLSYDVDRDPANGVIIATRDANGFETALTYDSAGRLIVSTPAEGASTQIDYANYAANPYLPAKVTTTMKSGTNVLNQSSVVLDDFGRTDIEKKLLPNGTFSQRKATWDVQDRLLTLSEWGDLSKKTTYSNFDPFGRARTVTPPDGAGHKLEFDFLGGRVLTSTVQRALSTGVETAVNRVEEYDSHGRLRKVLEQSGSEFADTPTVVINEVNANSSEDVDFGDFIELYGPPNQSLNGYVMVFFSGSDLRSYQAYDLDGFQLGSDGFFVLGDTITPNVDFGAFHGDTLLDGPDAVALYLDNAASFPNGTLVRSNQLIDALVYDTDDADVSGLLNVLTPGQEQVNEDGGSQSSIDFSNARVPNGGMAYSQPGTTARYGQQRPTPGLPNDPAIPTNYFYDVNSRLTRIDSGMAPVVQSRTSTYDMRGFLLSDSYPESPAGRTYASYNSLGSPTLTEDGEHWLEYRYDYFNRLKLVLDKNHDDRKVTENIWDTAPGSGLGKLHSTEQHNYIINMQNLPWEPPKTGEDVRVKQSFTYSGLGGAESQRETRILSSDGPVVFRQEWTLTDLGQLDTYTYPHCVSPSPEGCWDSDAGDPGGTPKVIDYNYSNGSLTNIADVHGGFNWATWTYHNSGSWQSISHTNGVTEHRALDVNLRNRTHRITTTGVTGGSNLDTGVLTYDGAGNLKTAGPASYTYDKVGRLASSINTGDIDQDFTYDPFGNMHVEDLDFILQRVDPLTNRFIEGNYDLSGNLLYYRPVFGGWHWFYNEGNKVAAQNNLNYVYDSNGERIATYSEGSAKYHLRDASGQRRSTIDYSQGNNTWQRKSDFITAGSRMVGSENRDGRFHFHLDQLGSTRIVTNEMGLNRHEFRYSPYGLEYNTYYGGLSNEDFNTLFTGHERDFSTGSDYMHARHYNSQLGRFTSLDPLKGRPSQPQSLNRYAYVAGNPLNATDPTGLSTNYLEQQHAPDNPYFAFGLVDIFNRFGSGRLFAQSQAYSDRRNAAQSENQDFKPGWLSGAIGSDFKLSWEPTAEDLGDSGSDFLTYGTAAGLAWVAGKIASYENAIYGGYQMTSVGRGQNALLFARNGFTAKGAAGLWRFQAGVNTGLAARGLSGQGLKLVVGRGISNWTLGELASFGAGRATLIGGVGHGAYSLTRYGMERFDLDETAQNGMANFINLFYGYWP